MTPSYKPFRLINSQELQTIEHTLSRYLNLWNEQYALFPLNLTLSTAPTMPVTNQPCQIANHHQKDLVLWYDSPNQLIKHSLFGDRADCFDAISQAQFLLLLEQLLNTKELNSQTANITDDQRAKDWFYRGAPTITMTLKSKHEAINLYLHPHYVLSILPYSPTAHKPKSTLASALAEESLHCQIDFKPLSLRLQDLQQLRRGDVIKMDHRLNEPLHLVHQQQLISHVELGASQSLKSIQITSLL